MYHVISLIVVFVSFSNRISAQTYASATCNGEICALLSLGPTIKCTTGGTDVDFTPYVVTPHVGGNSEPIFKSAAVNPIDGQIYILFVLSGTTYLGTIPDPSTDTAPFNITRIGDVGLTAEEYTSLTFDCEGNAYATTVGNEPEITQIDITTGTDTVVDQIPAEQTCFKFIECHEVFTYDSDAGYFLRISTAPGVTELPPRLFIRQDIEGPDIQDNENGTIIDFNGKCDDGRAIHAFSYIGNDIALIYCQVTDSAHILDLSDINNPIIQDAPFPLTDDNTFGLFNYNSDGSICRPCTPAPTTAAMSSTYNSGSSSDSDTDSGSSAANDSGSGSDSGDGAEVAQNIQDMGFENTKKMSGAIIVDLSEKSVLHLWGLFAAFSVVNIIACWCVFKRDVKNLRVVTTKPPLIDL